MEKLGCGEDLVAKRLFGGIWVVCSCGCSGGLCFGAFPAAPRCKPSRAMETLGFGLLGSKGSEPTGLGNRLSFLFLSPKTWEAGAARLGVPGSEPLHWPHPGPAALGSGAKLLLKPRPLVWTLSFPSLIVKWLFCNDICLLIKETS